MYPHKITTTPTSRFASRPSRALRLNSSSASSESPAPFASAALKSGLPISQNSRTKTGTNRTTLPIRQLTAAQKRTEPGSKANRTRTKSRLFPASVSIHVLDFHPFAKNARINRTTSNISHTTRSKHAIPFHLTHLAPRIPLSFENPPASRKLHLGTMRIAFCARNRFDKRSAHPAFIPWRNPGERWVRCLYLDWKVR